MEILLLGGFGFIGTNILKYIDNYFPGKYSVVIFDRLLVHPFGMTFNCVNSVYTGDFGDIVYCKIDFESTSLRYDYSRFKYYSTSIFKQ